MCETIQYITRMKPTIDWSEMRTQHIRKKKLRRAQNYYKSEERRVHIVFVPKTAQQVDLRIYFEYM